MSEAAAGAQVLRIGLPRASAGTERTLTALRWGAAEARPKAYLQAGLHADEIPGMLVLNHLAAALDEAAAHGALRGQVVVVPVANPIGLAQHLHGRLLGRFDLGDDTGNFNRHYPDLAEPVAARVAGRLGADAQANVRRVREAMLACLRELSPQEEAQALRIALLRLAADADLALDLHCDCESLLHVYLGTPLWPAAQDLSAQMGSRATLLAAVSGGHPFDEALGGPWWSLAERFPAHPLPPACLAATVELRGEQDVSETLAREDAANLYRLLQRRGVLAGDPGPLPAPQCEATPLAGVDMVRAPAAGVVCHLKAPGDRVRRGETVAVIVDPLGRGFDAARTAVRTVTDGLLFERRTDRWVRPGQVLCKVAGAEPLPGREGGPLLTA